MNTPLKMAVAGVLTLCSLCFGQTAQVQPNVLIILADDVGFGDIPANYPHAMVPMPNIQRLADNGLRFLDAHSTSSVCAPTRYSLLSGNYPWRGRRPYGTWNYNGGTQFKKGQLTLAQILMGVGYHTAMFGKVHTGAHVYPRDPSAGFDESWHPPLDTIDLSKPLVGGPRDMGFNYSFTTPAGIQDNPYAYFENDLMLGDQESLVDWKAGEYPNGNGVSKISPKHDGFGVPSWESNNYAIDMVNKAIAFLDRHIAENKASGSEQPFFMYFCTETAHIPHSPPIDFFGMPVKGQFPSEHLDMLYELDLIVGKLLTEIETHGKLEDTLVIFASDNGGLDYSDYLGHDASGGYRGKKGSIYEGGHRIPMIMSWPAGGVLSGEVYPHLTGIQDLYKTLCDLLGLEVPKGQARDSISFKNQLEGSISTPHRISLMTQTIKGQGDLSYRDEAWKLILKRDGQPYEFYNLEQDPFEADDLMGNPEFSAKIQQMHRDFLKLNPKGLIHLDSKNIKKKKKK
jgi:arylsulfatase A